MGAVRDARSTSRSIATPSPAGEHPATTPSRAARRCRCSTTTATYYWNEQQVNLDGRFALDRTTVTGIGWRLRPRAAPARSAARRSRDDRSADAATKGFRRADGRRAARHHEQYVEHELRTPSSTRPATSSSPISRSPARSAGPRPRQTRRDYRWVSRSGGLMPRRSQAACCRRSTSRTRPMSRSTTSRAFVPALVADRFDELRATLGTPAEHTIDDAATALLVRARAALRPGMYRWGAFEIAVDGAHRFGWRRTTEAGLDETASFDGTTWTRRYGELGPRRHAHARRRRRRARARLPAAVDRGAGALRALLRRQGEAGTTSRSRATAPRCSCSRSTITRASSACATRAATTLVDGDVDGADGPSAARAFGEDLAVGYAAEPIADAPAWALAGTSARRRQSSCRAPRDVLGRPARAPRAGSAAWRTAAAPDASSRPRRPNNRPQAFAAYEALRAARRRRARRPRARQRRRRHRDHRRAAGGRARAAPRRASSRATSRRPARTARRRVRTGSRRSSPAASSAICGRCARRARSSRRTTRRPRSIGSPRSPASSCARMAPLP